MAHVIPQFCEQRPNSGSLLRLAQICGIALIALVLLLNAPVVAWSQASGESTQLTESRIKAAFLYKFAGYVQWPDKSNTQEPLNIGVIGAEAIVGELMQLVPGRMVDGRPIRVRAVDAQELPGDLHILFIAKPESGVLTQYAQSLQNQSVLVVTEAEGMLKQGSVINFVIVEQRVKFDVSLESAAKSRLKLSSRLLAVAHKVLGAS